MPAYYVEELLSRSPYRWTGYAGGKSGVKQSSAGVAVAAEDERSTNRRSEVKGHRCSWPSAAWPRTHLIDDDPFRCRQAAAMTFDTDIGFDRCRGIVMLLQVAGRNVRSRTDPRARRTEQRIAVVHWFDDQMIEPTQATGPQLGQSSRHAVEQTPVVTLRSDLAINRPRRRHDQPGDRVISVGPAVCRQKHVSMLAGAVGSTVRFVS